MSYKRIDAAVQCAVENRSGHQCSLESGHNGNHVSIGVLAEWMQKCRVFNNSAQVFCERDLGHAGAHSSQISWLDF